MRQLTLIATILAAAAFGLSAADPAPKTRPKLDPPKKNSKDPKVLFPKGGVKTPGVQIPLASLKSEAEITIDGLNGPLLFTDQVYSTAQTKNTVVRLDPKTNKPGEPIAGLDQPCAGLVNAFGSLWVPNCGAQTLSRLDPKNGKITATVSVGVVSGPSVIAASPDSVWLLSDTRTVLSRIDPEANAVVAEVRLEPGCNALLFAETALWVTCPSINKVIRVDPRTNLAVNRIEVAAKPVSLSAGEGSIWVLGQTDGKVSRLDPKTNKVSATIDLGLPNAEGTIAFGEGSVWVSAPGFPLSRIHPATDQVVQQFYGDGGGLVQVGTKALWLTDRKLGKIVRFDPKRILATLAE